ncbi:phage tail assembly protein [Hydrogenimonas sp.]
MKIELSNRKTVEMREPLVRDMKVVSKITDDLEREIALLSNLTEMTPDEIESLTMADFNKLDKELQGFLS